MLNLLSYLIIKKVRVRAIKMSIEFEELALIKYLKKKNSSYCSKITELRKNVGEWLSYVPATFPNYTCHTIKHSDEIILQLSRLLFTNGDYSRPVVSLSAIEAYILACSAYLHDAGMVVSEKEKSEILASSEWNQFISNENTVLS
jgi:molecular chaperone HtpG